MENALMCMWHPDVIDFVRDLIGLLDIKIDFYSRNLCIEDREGNLRALEYKGKYLRLPVDYYESEFADSIVFDPVGNKNIMKFLFDIMIDEWDEDVYLANYYKIYGSEDDPRSQLHVLMSDGTQFTTRKYYNSALQFMEIMDFMIIGLPNAYDYTRIDFPPEIDHSKKRKRRG